MIRELPDTTTSKVAKELLRLRDEGGAVALGRVLTLLVETHVDGVERAVEIANDASREHPCRVIVLAADDACTAGRVDGQIRVGGDAGASEVVVLRTTREMLQHSDTLVMPLLLPDAPIVVWWPDELPSAPADHPLGRMAQRRITDTVLCTDPRAALDQLQGSYRDGDTDLAWTRLTVWRGLLAAALDQPPHEPVRRAVVSGRGDHPSVWLLAAWLAQSLRCPVSVVEQPAAEAVTRVELDRASGPVVIDRPDGRTATLEQPGQPQRRVSMPLRQLDECVAEELRRLDPDEVYGEVLVKGLDRIGAA
ncbi:glucose-6-phosphate dehydrogenase assembly protein OpcA [Actinotalea sp. AC32]|nr:glucose-6-phosphate dehydrogenase assembly protein OpcA [Actinotalea sp. AC32]